MRVIAVLRAGIFALHVRVNGDTLFYRLPEGKQ